jgi:hypothetical protein
MNLKRLIAAFFILALNLAIIRRAYSEPIIFAQVNNPTGIVVDSTGSVFVQSLPLPEFGGSGLLKFDANGNLMNQNNQSCFCRSLARSFLLPPMPQPRTLFQRMEAGRSLLAA